MSTPHLTEEQFADLLSGDSSTALQNDLQLHLHSCPACTSELERVQIAIGSFNAMSLAWAEQEAPRRVRVPFPRSSLWHARPVWGTATAAIAAAAIIFGLHEQTPKPVPAHPTVTHPGTTIAEDNRLLSDIDRDLQYHPDFPVPVSELGLSPEGGSPRDSTRRVAN